MGTDFTKSSYRLLNKAQRPIKRSPVRPSDQAHCPRFPQCIGCPLIHIPYSEQLRIKRDIVGRALAGYPSLSGVQVPPVVSSPHRLGYRARVKLVVRRSVGEVATGLYVPGTHRVSDISSCPVHPPAVNRVTRYLKKKIVELGIVPYDERNDTGQLRYLDFRYSFSRRELSVTLVTRRADFPQGLPLARSVIRKFPFTSGVVQNINEQRGNVIWGDRYRVLCGRDTIVEQIGSLKLGFPAGVFSQANPSTAKAIYQTVYEMAAPAERDAVLDLYCGVGPISLFVARSARLVVGIDESSVAIASAKQNARRNGVSNSRFLAGDVAENIADASKIASPIDTIVLNPPRKGLMLPALNAMLSVGAPKLIYVSCEPNSLARDLDRLTAQGYRVIRLQPFDMFPQTDQVETVVLLERGRF